MNYNQGDKVYIKLYGQPRPAIVAYAAGQNTYILDVAFQDLGGKWHVTASRPTAGARILPGRTALIPELDQCEACGKSSGDKSNDPENQCGVCGRTID